MKSDNKFNPYHDELGRFTFSPTPLDNAKPENSVVRRYSVTTEVAPNKEGQRVTIYRPDGNIEIRQGGHLNWRNNNPGNLIYGSFTLTHGAIGRNGRFAVFSDEQTGYNASAALIKGPSYAFLTINQAIAKRSPKGENDTVTLQREILSETGLSGSRAIRSLNDLEFYRLLEAIHWHEGRERGTVVITKPKS